MRVVALGRAARRGTACTSPWLTEAQRAHDRRGLGQGDKPRVGYDYDTLADDLAGLLDALDLRDVTLVGFSMGGGEVAHCVARHGEERLHSVVFAVAVPPYLLETDDNPNGPLTEDAAQQMEEGAKGDRDAFFDQFTTQFFSAGADNASHADAFNRALLDFLAK